MTRREGHPLCENSLAENKTENRILAATLIHEQDENRLDYAGAYERFIRENVH